MDLDGAVRLFKSLSDPTRLRLLRLLQRQELNVQELERVLAMGQSRVSRHLRLLQQAGLVSCRRDGLWSFYRAAERGPEGALLDASGQLLDGETAFAEDLARAGALLREDRARRRRFFDGLAPDWESLKTDILGELDLGGELLKEVPRCGAAADLGCGNGTLLEALRRKVPRVIGVDASRGMLELARRRLEAGAQGVDLRVGELEHLPLRDAEVECALTVLVLHHLREPLQGLREAWRTLAGAGTLVVCDLCKHDQEALRSRYGDIWLGFTRKELTVWLARAGFRLLDWKELAARLGLSLFIASCRKTAQPARGIGDGIP
jgi:DNA-binding transcriptional ArsR family regulator